jgi:hypothetical protein
LLEDETDELVRKAVALAKDGDVVMLKFLLDRILPKERPVRVDIPASQGEFDAVKAMEAILLAAGSGQILPSEASALAGLVAAYARTIEITEHSERLGNIENQIGALKSHGESTPSFEK